ncbi:unnamed protein product [Leptosia nina]|uniref:Uncharacterized protein n=1 Tax=Leptosia nina TaxID=320188 RepID=A0AAV1IXA4_9NEOP
MLLVASTLFLLSITVLEARVLTISEIPITSHGLTIKVDIHSDGATASLKIIETERNITKVDGDGKVYEKVVPSFDDRSFIDDNKCAEGYRRVGTICVKIKPKVGKKSVVFQ